jgi:hypothetical protein
VWWTDPDEDRWPKKGKEKRNSYSQPRMKRTTTMTMQSKRRVVT